eukprot:gnl/Chilomastix_cuspidata/586.p2 GENE.gnl/Chilomastix_cuspidata/586~~gnl/Chilomastix_cuspidata/586.p2  ORF type:complete len:425 (-),score=195.40 gnl/Chilomastix_cuspidata/586:1366-2640(-)
MSQATLNKGISVLKDATDADREEKFEEAKSLYVQGIRYLMHFIKYNTNERLNESLREKVNGYLKRAEEIKKLLDEGRAPVPPAGGPAPPKSGGPSGSGKKGDDGEEAKLSGAISSAIVREKPNVKWDEVAGLEAAKGALQEAVILPAKFPHLFVGKRQPWRGILLYGPPGTGKSYIAKAVATECQATFFSISSSDLVSKWQGESERLVKSLFEMARKERPSIVFIDEIDSLCSARSDNESESSRRIKTEFLVQMQGVGSDQTGVLILGATNIPGNLDSAIRRRFEKRICINLPRTPAREIMFKIHSKGTPHSLTPDQFRELAERTEGYSGSDISTVVRDALMNPIRRMQTATAFRCLPNGKWIDCAPDDDGAVAKTLLEFDGDEIETPKVSFEDFLNALKNVRPSVGPEDLAAIGEFTAKYGSE